MIAVTILLSLVAGGQEGWKPITSAWITGFERSAEGPKRNFVMERSQGVTSFAFVRPLQGVLTNLERVEQFSASGIETWLTRNPGWSLRLYEPSRPDLESWLRSPRFSAADLQKNQSGVSQIIGQPVKYLGTERVAGRESHSLQISAKPIEKLLLDTETGIPLRFEQRDAGGIYYERQIETVDFASVRLPLGDAKRKIIKGIPNAEILTKADWRGKRQDYLESLSRAEKTLKSFDPKWLRTLSEIKGFDFRQTIVDSKAGRKVDGIWPVNRLGGPEWEPGGLPPGWTVDGAVDPEEDTIFFTLNSPIGPAPRVLIQCPRPGTDGSSFEVTMSRNGEVTQFSFVSYISQDGRLVIAPGKSGKEAEARRREKYEQLSGAGASVWTDFMNDQGDTVSFAQLRNKAWKSMIRVPSLPKSAPVTVREGVAGETFTLPQLVILHWKQGGTDYVLASSSLTGEALLEIAQKL